MVFNLEVASPTVVVNHLWKGRQKIFCVHSSITFALSEFRWGSLCYSGLLQWVAVQKVLKTIGLDASVQIMSGVWAHSHSIAVKRKAFKNTYVGCGKTRNSYWRDQYHKFPSKQNISSTCFDSQWSNHLKTIGKKFWLLLNIWLEIVDEWFC